MIFYAKSDIGRSRTCNEDSYGYSVPEDRNCSLFVVADGMGGQKAGEVASRIAVTSLIEQFEENIGQSDTIDAISAGLRGGIAKANRLVLTAAAEQDEYHGMGTTVVCACVTPKKLVVLNVGDSRAYLISGKAGAQLTVDHSLVEHLVRIGHIDRTEAKLHPRRNEITRALGAAKEVQEDLFLYDYQPGDVLLLCSDGLTRMVDDREIFRVAAKFKNPKTICSKLIELANNNGGADNTTVIAVVLG